MSSNENNTPVEGVSVNTESETSIGLNKNPRLPQAIAQGYKIQA